MGSKSPEKILTNSPIRSPQNEVPRCFLGRVYDKIASTRLGNKFLLGVALLQLSMGLAACSDTPRETPVPPVSATTLSEDQRIATFVARPDVENTTPSPTTGLKASTKTPKPTITPPITPRPVSTLTETQKIADSLLSKSVENFSDSSIYAYVANYLETTSPENNPNRLDVLLKSIQYLRNSNSVEIFLSPEISGTAPVSTRLYENLARMNIQFIEKFYTDNNLGQTPDKATTEFSNIWNGGSKQTKATAKDLFDRSIEAASLGYIIDKYQEYLKTDKLDFSDEMYGLTMFKINGKENKALQDLTTATFEKLKKVHGNGTKFGDYEVASLSNLAGVIAQLNLWDYRNPGMISEINKKLTEIEKVKDTLIASGAGTAKEVEKTLDGMWGDLKKIFQFFLS
ncbi:MAG: hypothetical protein WCJ19_02725 [bacterium]